MAEVEYRSPRRDLMVAGAMVGVLSLVVVPLPSAILDLLLAGSLATAVLVFLMSIYIERPLDFSSFPALLLFVTLYRLALNVASTRLILSNGGEGMSAAGSVIQSFGSYAVGGNYVIGAVIFLILIIINYIVITKGAERISEVGARFTLDKMPGKQMAIDADLSAGTITEAEAKTRRRDIDRESEFYGAMDGASKFVRGDAVAGLIITGINVLGGIIIGVIQEGMPIGEAASTYTVLSIGDGLVSQIPALLISSGSGLLATRSDRVPLGDALGAQMLSRKRPLMIAASVLFIVGAIPGMPHLAFFALAALAAFLATRADRFKAKPESDDDTEEEQAESAAETDKKDPEVQRAEIESMLPVDLLALEVGLDLLPMVDPSKGGELLQRIASLRKQIAGDMGVIVPPVHVRDDLRMRPGAYRIQISGVKVADGEIRAGRVLAIDPTGRATNSIPGEKVREPTFGLPAKWVFSNDRSRAEAAGCTVVDASAVVATHLTEIIRRHAADLMGRAEAQELIDVASKKNEKVVEELIPQIMSLGDVIKVLRSLLQENIPVRDMRTILETLADNGNAVKDPGELTELVRQRLGRRITRDNLADNGELRAMVLDPRAEDMFREGSARGRDPRALTRLTNDLEGQTRQLVEQDEPPVLVVAPDIRRAVSQVANRHIPGLAVMSYREVDPAVPFVTRKVIGVDGRAAA